MDGKNSQRGRGKKTIKNNKINQENLLLLISLNGTRYEHVKLFLHS
jgi:hypothetical protein